MSYLFYIDDKTNVILRPECVKLCPELSVLTNEEVLFIILAFDYHSIYRQFPEHERIRKAMFHVFEMYDSSLLEKTSIKIGIEAYKSLQYDKKIEFAERLQKKVETLLNLIDEDDVNISRRLKDINDLRQTISGLESEVAESFIKKGQLRGDQEMSWLEELQSNRKYYLSLKK